MKVEGKSWHTISRRTLDSFPNSPEKKKFEKYIDAYFIKIMRCNTYWEILKSRKSTKEDFILTYKYAPAFWNAVIYSLQMGIITDLVSFLSNDEASLSKYLDNIITNKDKIFTRKFYETWQDDQTGELSEIECKNKKSNDEALEECKFLLETSNKYLPILKKARDKVYCHLDKKSLSFDDCNNEIFCYINNNIVEEIINNISKTISILYALYSNIWKEGSYANKDDVRNIIQIIKTYDKYQDKILEIRSNEIEKEFNMYQEENGTNEKLL